MKMKVYPPQGYRKWWLAAVALILSGVFVLLGFVNGSEWNVGIGLVLGLGGMSSVGEHFAKRKKDGGS